MNIKQYGIYLVNLDPTLGAEICKTRPAIVISDNMMNKYLQTIVICPLTTSLHPQWRSRIQLICANKPAEIAIDQIRCISKARLIKKVDSANLEVCQQIQSTINQMYGTNQLT